MADNQARYGFRPVKGAYSGACHPKAVRKSVASGYQAQNDAAGFNVDLNVGDPVRILSTGYIELANTTEDVWGVIQSFGFYYNSGTGRMEPTSRLPGGTTWSGEEQRPWVMVVPVADHQLFEVDVDDAVTATTFAAYQALIGENVTHVCAGVSATARANPQLDISTHAVTAGLTWRIEDVSQSGFNQDYSGANVKLLVSCNLTQHAGAPADLNLKVGV